MSSIQITCDIIRGQETVESQWRRKVFNNGGTFGCTTKTRRRKAPRLSAKGAKMRPRKGAEVERRRREKRDTAGSEGVGYGEGACPLPNRLGDLGERRKLPRWGPPTILVDERERTTLVALTPYSGNLMVINFNVLSS